MAGIEWELYKNCPAPETSALVSILSAAPSKATTGDGVSWDSAIACQTPVTQLSWLYLQESPRLGVVSTILIQKLSRIAEAARTFVWVTQLEQIWTGGFRG